MKIKLAQKEKIKLAELFLSYIEYNRKNGTPDSVGHIYSEMGISIYRAATRPTAEIVREAFKIS